MLWIFDVIMIALQRLRPADGSSYVIDFYGPIVTATRFSNLTYVAEYTCFNCGEMGNVLTPTFSGEL